MIPERAKDFVIEIELVLEDKYSESSYKDQFRIFKRKDGKIQIIGTSGVAAAYGFNHYLKYYLKSQVSWETTNINIPKELPAVNIHIKSMDR